MCERKTWKEIEFRTFITWMNIWKINKFSKTIKRTGKYKHGPKWPICKQSLKENPENKFDLEIGDVYNK